MAFNQTTTPMPAVNLWGEVDNRAPGSYDGWIGGLLVMYLHFKAHASDTLKKIVRKIHRFLKSLKEKVAKLAKEMIEKLRGMLRKVKDLFRKVEGVVWDEEMGDTEEGMGED